MVHANIFTRLNRIISHNYKLIATAHSKGNEGGQPGIPLIVLHII